MIDGISQSTGVERVLEVESTDSNILLIIRDRVGNAERGRVLAPTDEIMTILTERPKGPQTVTPSFTMEVQRNEVLLVVGEADAAVGLDDLMDALAYPAAG